MLDVSYNKMKKIITIGIIFLSFINISCDEDKKHIKPKNIYNPSSEITQEIKNIKAASLFEISKGFYENRNYNQAINILNSALNIEKNPIIYNELGIVNTTIGNNDEAINYHKIGQIIDSTYYPNFINEASIQMKLGRIDIAELTLTKMIKNCQSVYWKAHANFYLAVLYFNNGRQCDKSKKYLLKAKTVKNDLNLKKIYEKFENTVENYCS